MSPCILPVEEKENIHRIYTKYTQKRASWDINYSQQSAYQVLDPETVETCAINQVQMRRL